MVIRNVYALSGEQADARVQRIIMISLGKYWRNLIAQKIAHSIENKGRKMKK